MFIPTTVVVPTTVPIQCPRVVPTTTVTLTTMLSSRPQICTPNTMTVTVFRSSDQPAMTGGGSSSASTTALGILLGIFVVLLVLVTIGWVWTCWIMKKRGGMKITSRQAK